MATFAGRARRSPQLSPSEMSNAGGKHVVLKKTSCKPMEPWSQGCQIRPPADSCTSRRFGFVVFAVAVYFASPVHAAVLWLTMVSNRRISEALRLRGTDINLDGGLHHDKPYIWVGRRTGNTSQEAFAGLGKLGADEVLSRISDEAVETIRALVAIGITWDALPPLSPIHREPRCCFRGAPAFQQACFSPQAG